MLNEVLTAEEKSNININVHDALKKLLKNLSEVYSITKLKERHHIARALKRSGLSRLEARSFGFRISKHLWYSCWNTEKRDVGGT